MRTKTLLLTAAALLAAGIVSSQAQSVYSQNVVGYASIKTSGGQFMMTVPFNVGASNGANEIWPLLSDGVTPSLPDGSSLLIWTGNSYVTYVSDSGSATLWDMADGSTPTNAPILKVGQGFFLEPASATTNVFAGTVAANIGTSNVVTLAGGQFLVAPSVPYAGSVTNGSLTTGAGGPNLWSPDGIQGLPDGSSVLIWTGNSYVTYVSDSGSATYWDMADGSTPTNAPSLNVGQAFFLEPASSFNWKVGL